MVQSGPERIFISYAHADTEWKDEFERMLAPARDRGIIELWSDENIRKGEKWYESIQRALETASIGLLLVSDNFLDSGFITTEELANFLSAAERGSCSIRWVPISACLYNLTPLGGLQACWNPAMPLDKLTASERKAAVQKICIELVEGLGATSKVSAGRKVSIRDQVQARLGQKYQVVDELATGKFSVVYRAEGVEPRRTVVVKTLVASELDDWARRGFREGVERAVELRSPAFIKIYDHYLEDSPEFLVTEFVEGEPLHKILLKRSVGLPLYQVKSILLDLANAILEAHERGGSRGEMCPSDILVEESGLPRLSAIDFSNVLREQSMLTGNFLVDRESLCYMTPERYFGHACSELTDQYSLGLIATELLEGPWLPRVVNPCDLQSKPQLFADLEMGMGTWARRSPEFAGVVCRMLRRDPDGRWPTMKVVRNLLREIEVAESEEELNRKCATSSYLRIQARGVEGEQEFFRVFYENLFEMAPDVKQHFRSIDMKHQYQVLNRAIHSLLDFRPESLRRRQELEHVASQHLRFGLTRRHYDLFVKSLLSTLRAQGETDEPTLEAWRRTVVRAIDFMWECHEKLTQHAAPAAEVANMEREKPVTKKRRSQTGTANPVPPA